MRRFPRAILAIPVLVVSSMMLLGPASGATREQKRDQMQSDLKNAATAEESYFTRAQTYTRILNNLKAEGLDPSANVRLIIVRAGEQSYCLEAQHDALGEIWHYSARVGTPERGRC